MDVLSRYAECLSLLNAGLKRHSLDNAAKNKGWLGQYLHKITRSEAKTKPFNVTKGSS